jgi:nifR3 family TIM-barrel protein
MMRRRKAAMVVSELISATGVHYTCKHTLEMFQFHEEEHPVGIQIFGSDSDYLCHAAQYAQEIGADFVDLNMGCSVPKVVKKGAGAALAANTIQLRKILCALVESVKIPVSIKIRTGWDENSRNAMEVVRLAEDAGIAWVTIHGRTSVQGYSGFADWDFIKSIKEKTFLPLVGNGDIDTAEKAMQRLKESCVDAVMIGRASGHNPFLFEECFSLWQGKKYTPCKKDYFQLLCEHRKCLEEYYTSGKSLVLAKKFLVGYASGFPECRKFRNDIFHTEDRELLWEKAFDFFENQIWQSQ